MSTSTTERMHLQLDRVKGMILGLAIGDSLGISYEFLFNRNKLDTYNGLIKETGETRDRYRKKVQYYPPGSVSDDTEMTITLMRSMIEEKTYDNDKVLLAYLKWANSGITMLGKNTRKLMKGVTTLRGYKNRMTKIDEKEKHTMLSNGALMRCSPLAIFCDSKAVATDCYFTNPNEICLDAEITHITALSLALKGIPAKEIYARVQEQAKTETVKEIFKLIAEKKEPETLISKKGFVANPLFFSMSMLARAIDGKLSYEDNIDTIINRKGTDTDTNGCIAGALLGALIGYEAMMKEKRTTYNAKMILTVDRSGKTAYDYIGPKLADHTYTMITRSLEYTLYDFDELCFKLYQLGKDIIR